MDRRLFCLSSVAAALSGAAAGVACRPAAGHALAVTHPAATPSAGVHQFLYDRRYAAARAFGAAAAGADSTARILAISGDITGLWARDLRAQWSTGGGALAGMTTAKSLFCLEQLAQDHWMRVVIRAEHMGRGREIAHRVSASQPMMARMTAALDSEDWPMKMPDALRACPGADGALRMTHVIRSARGHCLDVDGDLVSFVIA